MDLQYRRPDGSFVAAIKGLPFDVTVQQRSYDSSITCASYVNSTVAAWAAEAATFVAWRDSVCEGRSRAETAAQRCRVCIGTAAHHLASVIIVGPCSPPGTNQVSAAPRHSSHSRMAKAMISSSVE